LRYTKGNIVNTNVDDIPHPTYQQNIQGTEVYARSMASPHRQYLKFDPTTPFAMSSPRKLRHPRASTMTKLQAGRSFLNNRLEARSTWFQTMEMHRGRKASPLNINTWAIAMAKTLKKMPNATAMMAVRRRWYRGWLLMD
jgi:hypothetical protein